MLLKFNHSSTLNARTNSSLVMYLKLGHDAAFLNHGRSSNPSLFKWCNYITSNPTTGWWQKRPSCLTYMCTMSNQRTSMLLNENLYIKRLICKRQKYKMLYTNMSQNVQKRLFSCNFLGSYAGKHDISVSLVHGVHTILESLTPKLHLALNRVEKYGPRMEKFDVCLVKTNP